MALVYCSECGHQVSTEASFCPNCGYPFEKTHKNTTETIINTVKRLFTKKRIFLCCGMLFIVAVVLFCFVSSRNKLDGLVYTGVMPDMSRSAVEAKFSNGNKYDIQSRRNTITVVPKKNSNEFEFFGYPAEKLEISFNSNEQVSVMSARIDLSFESDVSSITKTAFNQLSELGTCKYKYLGNYGSDFTFVIDNSEYAVYVYTYNNPSARYKQYMEVAIVRADSGYFGLD